MDQVVDIERQAIVARIAAMMPFSDADAARCTTAELQSILRDAEAQASRYKDMGFTVAAR